jgi:1-deoxy-D-xylulose-5-phosphate reductoisomerase
VALANKETLVTGGHLVAAALDGLDGDPLDRLRPVDSEHSAIWQCLLGERIEDVRRLILTASGGPFRDHDLADLASVTPDEALAHPTWRMGPKITVDSATLVNKAFEIIEAKWLYRLPYSRIDAVIQPQSIVHSLVEFADGSVKAQLGEPDMRLPIQCALSYPERVSLDGPQRLNLVRTKSLNFSAPDLGRYPCLRLALEAGARGGTWPAVLAAADEVAVESFMAGRIGFTDIAKVVDSTLSAHAGTADPVLEAVLEADRWAREHAAAQAASMAPLAKAR